MIFLVGILGIHAHGINQDALKISPYPIKIGDLIPFILIQNTAIQKTKERLVLCSYL